MKRIWIAAAGMGWPAAAAWAQDENLSFFDKYFPVARLLDSPLVFGIVVGSGVLLLLLALAFLSYVKKMEAKVAAWGQTQTPENLVAFLDSDDPSEAQRAFAYLRKHGGQKEIGLMVERLQDQRQKGQINPNLIYLMEDLQAATAIPVLQQIARGKSKAAPLAEKALLSICHEETDPRPAAQT